MSPAELLDAFGTWAWERHHNILSWYIRPLFLIPLAWFAYRRNGWGVAATIVALATSMFWFPAPDTTDPRVEEFLAFERRWLTGDWTATKAAQALLVPLSLTAYVLAFWRRSLAWGLVLLNGMAAGKLIWGVFAGDGTGWAMTAPALAGLAVGDVILGVVYGRRRRPDRAAEAALARFRADHPVRRHTAEGVEWSYRTGGSGPGTVLYLPGGTGHAEAAFGYLSHLERNHRVIAVDYPDVPSMTALTDGLLAVMAAEDVEDADVWGTSFGGMVAQVLVRRAPERVASMVLSNTAAPDPARAARAARQARFVAALPAPVARRLFGLAAGRQVRSLPAPQRDFWRSYLRQQLAADGKDRLVRLSRLAADFHRRRLRPDDLATWPGRVLLLSAADDELYREMRSRLRYLYPRAREVLLAGGHATTLGHQAEYLDAVEAFLDRPAVEGALP